MAIDFGRLRIEQVIVHAIPRAVRDDPNPAPLRLSEVASPLDDVMRAQLQSRLRGDLHASREVVENPDIESPVPKVIRVYLSEESSDFVHMSRELAQHLRDSQNGHNPDGMLLVAECSLPESRALMVVKLEHQSGVQASFSDSQGKKTFDVQQVPDLMYTSKSRVYKIGFFRACDIEGEFYSGWVTDKQNSNGTAAQFFLATYLGCMPRQDPAVVTQAFYDNSVKWVNSQDLAPERKSAYLVSLHAELLSQSSDVNPRDFARKYLNEEHRDSFLAAVCGDEIPQGGFPKDVERVVGRLSAIQIGFVGGTSVVAPRNAFDDGTVKIERADNGKSRLVVTDDVTEFKGKSKGGAKSKKDKSEPEADEPSAVSQACEGGGE